MTSGTPPDFEYDVFISYSHKNSAWVVDRLLPRLETAGLKVCIDFRDFRPGAPSVTEMERAALTSRQTILVLSPEYIASDWTAFENIMLQTLDPVNRTLRVVPVLIAKVDLPPRIGAMNYISFVDPDDVAFTWGRLLNALGAPTTSSRPLRTVICYTPTDQKAVRRIYDHLRTGEFEPWTRDLSLLPGQDLEEETRKAVQNADVVITCLSQSAINADGTLDGDIDFVLRVADEYRRGDIYHIPLRLEACTLPGRLQRLKPVDYFEPDGPRQLLLALRTLAN